MLQDLHVQCDRVIPDVVQVQRDELFYGQLTPSQPPQPGETRAHREQIRQPALVCRHLIGANGPRADQTQVEAQHVPEGGESRQHR